MESPTLSTTAIIITIFGCVTYLTAIGKIPPHTITALIGMVVGWVLKTGQSSVVAARAARNSSRPPPPTFDGEPPTSRKARQDAVTQPMPPVENPKDKP